MDRMRNVDGHLGWYKDPMINVWRTKDDKYAVGYMAHQSVYLTWIKKKDVVDYVTPYEKGLEFDTLDEAIHWCEMHRAVGA